MSDAALLREILNAQLEMVCRFDADGTILFANRAYGESIGADADELAGENLWQFVTGEDQNHVKRQLALLTPDAPAVTIENRFETTAGTRWILWKNHAVRFDAAGRWVQAQSTGIDITERKQLEQQLELVIEELNHRVKNTLMVTQSLAWQTFRGTTDAQAAMATFSERLGALAAAHTTLSRGNWSGADMVEVARSELAPYADAGRIVLDGPKVTLPAEMTVPLVMALHELATNAAKYGALSARTGVVSLGWSLDGAPPCVSLCWIETGGPAVSAPSRKGFGTRLITELVTRQLAGTMDMQYGADGLTCRMTFPIQGTRP